LTDLFQSALDLDPRRRDESPILEKLREELESVNGVISEEFAILTRPRLGHEKLMASNLKPSFAVLEEKVIARSHFRNPSGGPGDQRLCRAEPAATGRLDHDHRIVPGIDPWNGHCRSRWKNDLAGTPADTFQG
jgi:hypothetical protein